MENETIWLSQKQIALLFDKDVRTINEHIINIYKEQELEQNPTIRNFRIVQKEGSRDVERDIEHYNLDVIISVWYRVSSVRGTQFRIWATKTLKDFLLKGYVLNEQKLLETQNKFKELQTVITFMQEKSKAKRLAGKESEILNLLGDYAKTLTLLQAYDHGNIPETKGTTATFELTYEMSKLIIEEVKKGLLAKSEASDLFGNARNNSLEGIIGGLYQTFSGEDLYPTIEDKTANFFKLKP